MRMTTFTSPFVKSLTFITCVFVLRTEGSSPWNLIAGHSYYIEALTCNVDGTDYLSVGMQNYGNEEFSQTPITTTFFSEMRIGMCVYL